MAIMNTCCCCGVRSGSVACAVYAIIIAVLGVITFSAYLIGIDDYVQLLAIEYGVYLNPNYVVAVKANYWLSIVIQSAAFITSIMALIGICNDTKGLLVPFIAAKSVGFIWYMYDIGLCMFAVITIGYDVVGYALVAELILLFPFLITDIVCVLCVLSQYQEYRDGRGRAIDGPVCATQRQTTVIVQQQHMPSAGGFAYQHMQEDMPPAYSNPPPVKTVPGAI